MSWTNLEHDVWKLLKLYGLESKKSYFLAVSGGLDSMVLLHVMQRIRPQAEIIVGYYHHGPGDSEQQTVYRDQSLELVQIVCLKYADQGIKFIFEKSLLKLNSEAAFREARWQFFRKSASGNQPLLTAHHLDDWIETLTLKLIRGVGPEGFTSLRIWNQEIFRPFLETKKAVLLDYAKSNSLTWLEDPSNDSCQYLRNWLRNEWFKSLDEKNPSGYENYSRSLLRLCQELEAVPTFELRFFSNTADLIHTSDEANQLGLDRKWFFSLSETHQMKALALFLRHHSIFNISQGQIAEIQKRLDKNQKDITFSVGHVTWLINVNQIMLEF